MYRANVDRQARQPRSQQGLREQKDSAEPATRWARTDIDAETNHARSIAHGCERFPTHRPPEHCATRRQPPKNEGDEVIAQRAGVRGGHARPAPGPTMIGEPPQNAVSGAHHEAISGTPAGTGAGSSNRNRVRVDEMSTSVMSAAVQSFDAVHRLGLPRGCPRAHPVHRCSILAVAPPRRRSPCRRRKQDSRKPLIQHMRTPFVKVTDR